MEKYNIPESNSLDSMEGIERTSQEDILNDSKIEEIKEIFSTLFEDKRIAESIVKGVLNSEVVDFDEMVKRDNITKPRNPGHSDSSLAEGVYCDLVEDLGFFKKIDTLTQETKDLFGRFQGKIIIDIGSGTNDSGYYLAQNLGASGYIAIEPHHSDELNRNLSDKGALPFYRAKKGIDKNIPFVVVNTDGLTFLKSVKANSANTMMIATDGWMFGDKVYNKEVNNELTRIIGSNGVSFEFDSIISAGQVKRDDTEEEVSVVYGRDLLDDNSDQLLSDALEPIEHFQSVLSPLVIAFKK